MHKQIIAPLFLTIGYSRRVRRGSLCPPWPCNAKGHNEHGGPRRARRLQFKTLIRI